MESTHRPTLTDVTFEHFGAFADWLVTQPMPTEDTRPGGPSRLADGYKLRAKLLDNMRHVELRDGILHWRANDRIIPPFAFSDAYLPIPKLQRTAYNVVTAEELKSYTARQKPASGEELAEMRAEFGKGTTVVDVLSGRRTQL